MESIDGVQWPLLVMERDGSDNDQRSSLVPPLAVMLASFTSFLLAAGTIIRERENGTLPLLLMSPKIGWERLFLGKIMLPLLAGVVVLLLLTSVSYALLGFGMKPGFLSPIALQGAGLTAITFQGIVVSCLLRTQFQATVAGAGYLIALILFTNGIFLFGEEQVFISFIGDLLPATSMPHSWTGWMYHGAAGGVDPQDVTRVLIQLTVCALLARLGRRP